MLALSSAFVLNTNCSGEVAELPGDPGEEVDGKDSEDGGDGDDGGSGDGDGDGMGTGQGGIRGQFGPIDVGPAELVEDTTPTGQVDMLFVVDNSVSMADKQEMLRRAIPKMIRDLVDPPCISDGGQRIAAVDDACPDGSHRQHAPVDDIHIGVISSSLGGHGSRMCPRGEQAWNNDDQAHLIPTVRTSLTGGAESAFLEWKGGDSDAVEALIADLSEQVSAVGENGCGFEAPLEAFYRFLVDPSPPQAIELNENAQAEAVTDGAGNMLIDTELLAQRDAFLRPESLVNVIIVTDENDCSAMDGGEYYENASFGYLAAETTFEFPVATEVCESNPNDPCCFSCLQAANPPAGCGEEAASCDFSQTLAPEDDRANLRCFDHKRRFGVDLLYPTDRYVKALRDRVIVDARTGDLTYNPLLTGVGDDYGTVRPHGRVYFTGIVGVPWQDVATPESLDDPATFEYLTAEEIAAETVEVDGEMVSRWEVMLGSPGLAASTRRCQEDPSTPGCGEAPTPPLDPFMISSVAPREFGAKNPISGDAIVDFNSQDPRANHINGHEANHQVSDPLRYPDGGPANDDLQYACTFELETPKADCSADDLSCDCGAEPLRNRSLCQPPEGGPAGTTQYYAKAYPGTRILEVLRDYGRNSVVNSICPKAPAEGYTPALTATVARMKERFPEAP